MIDEEHAHALLECEARDTIIAAKIGDAFMRRRKFPRVRFRRTVRGPFDVIYECRTRRSAFKAAKRWRRQNKHLPKNSAIIVAPEGKKFVVAYREPLTKRMA